MQTAHTNNNYTTISKDKPKHVYSTEEKRKMFDELNELIKILTDEELLEQIEDDARLSQSGRSRRRIKRRNLRERVVKTLEATMDWLSTVNGEMLLMSILLNRPVVTICEGMTTRYDSYEDMCRALKLDRLKAFKGLISEDGALCEREDVKYTIDWLFCSPKGE